MPRQREPLASWNVEIHPTSLQTSAAAAEHVASALRRAVAERGEASMALSGGHTAETFLPALAALGDQVPWPRVAVYWVDERFVPPDHADSNFGLARRLLLAGLPTPPMTINPFSTTSTTPDEAAAQYSQLLRQRLGDRGLDVVFLGLGADGHTASLFPASQALRAEGRGAVAHVAGQADGWRLTLTLTELNAARLACFVVFGADKAAALALALSTPSPVPAGLVRSAEGRPSWFADLAAASTVFAAFSSVPPSDVDRLKRISAEAALAEVQSGMTVGLGTGSTAYYVIEGLAARLADGRLTDVVGVPTSVNTTDHAHRLGVPLRSLDEVAAIDLAIDGTDEVTPTLDLTKGHGGALVRERLVALAARRFVVVADGSKAVSTLATRAPVPLAVVPFGAASAIRALAAAGIGARLRLTPSGAPLATDDGLAVVDAPFDEGLADPQATESWLRSLPGVVDTGLFLGLASAAYMAYDGGVMKLARA